MNRISGDPPEILRRVAPPHIVAMRCWYPVDRLESQRPMRKTTSYRMKSVWRTNDKLFMFPHAAHHVASTLICGGSRRVHLFLWSAVC